MAYAGDGNLRPLRHFGHTPTLYACRGLPPSGFALPWRTAIDLPRAMGSSLVDLETPYTCIRLVPCCTAGHGTPG